MKVCCVFSLESPQQDHTIYHFQYIKKKITLNYPKFASVGFFQGTEERVGRGKRAISVRATEVLLYLVTYMLFSLINIIRKYKYAGRKSRN